MADFNGDEVNVLETVCLFLGLGLGSWVVYHGFHVGWFTVTKKPPVRWRCPHDIPNCAVCQSLDEWRVSQEREERLKAAAIWRGYKR